MQVLEIRKQVLGPEHPDTLTSTANLASTYWDQGQLNEAEELGVQVLELQKQVLGPEHPDTLTSMAKLAYIWESLERVQDALALLKECVQLRTKILSQDHPHTRASLNTPLNTLRDWEAMERILLDQHSDPLDSASDATLSQISPSQLN